MKKLKSHFVCLCFFAIQQVVMFPIVAQTYASIGQSEPAFVTSSGVATLVPTETFVGDTAEIKFRFSTDSNLCLNNQTLTLTGSEFTALAWPLGSTMAVHVADMCDVLSISILPIGNVSDKLDANRTYLLDMQFIPWKTGVLDVPLFDVLHVFGLDLSSSDTCIPLMIDLPTVTIGSIIDKLQKKSLQPSSGPVVIPGTTWIVYLLLILAVGFVFLIALVVVRFKSVQKLIGRCIYKMFLNKNYQTAIKTLTKLEKNVHKISCRDFSSGVSDEIRRYLQNRFGVRFTAVETSKLYVTLDNKMSGLLSENATFAMENLQSICTRLDYIKFSGAEEATITDDFSKTIQQIFESLAYLEKREDDNEF